MGNKAIKSKKVCVEPTKEGIDNSKASTNSIRKPYIAPTKEEIEGYKNLTNFSEKEIRQWHRGFWEDCPNGKLDENNFCRIFKESYINDVVRAEAFWKYVKNMITELNTGTAEDPVTINDSFTIDFRTFLLMITPSAQGKLADRLELAFQMYKAPDLNGQVDQIDERGLKNLIEAMFHLLNKTKDKDGYSPTEYATRIMETQGIDKNKKLSKEEFIRAIHENKELKSMLAPYSKEDPPANNKADPSGAEKEQV